MSNFPLMIYQTGLKFRDEMSPKFGFLRSREFIMNDLYSFHLCDEDAKVIYQCVSEVLFFFFTFFFHNCLFNSFLGLSSNFTRLIKISPLRR